MPPTIDKFLGTTEISLGLLKVLAENSFDSILVTDATVKGKITGNRTSTRLEGKVWTLVKQRVKPKVLMAKAKVE